MGLRGFIEMGKFAFDDNMQEKWKEIVGREVNRIVSGNNPMQEQIGGDHYRNMKIQPLEYSMANGLNAAEHSVVKYVSRHRNKGGKQDLEKAIDMLQKLIAFEYGD